MKQQTLNFLDWSAQVIYEFELAAEVSTSDAQGIIDLYDIQDFYADGLAPKEAALKIDTLSSCFDEPDPEEKHWHGATVWNERNADLDDDGSSGDLYEDSMPDPGDYE
jgi:hypothetical protein